MAEQFSPFHHFNLLCTRDRITGVILFRGGLTTNPWVHFVHTVFFFFLLSFANKFAASPKNEKSLTLSHQGFVVAGTGFEPMTFGL